MNFKFSYKNRREAGKTLASQLNEFISFPIIVLSLPRGGTIVAAEIAAKFNAIHDVVIVRKIGAPYAPEVAIGALTQDGQFIANKLAIEALAISKSYIDERCAIEIKEIKRRWVELRGSRPFPDLNNQSIVLVDDGLATGYTMEAAIISLKTFHPKQLILAVPVGPAEVIQRFKKFVDTVICPLIPEDFRAIVNYYEDFHQTTIDEVHQALY